MKPEPTSSIDEKDLIRRLLLRHDSAWSEFLHHYQRLICSQINRTAARLNHRLKSSEVEDLCATVLTELLQQDMKCLRAFDGRSKLSTWLTVVTRRITLRQLTRKRPPECDGALLDGHSTRQPDALTALIRTEDQHRLKSSIESLDPGDREILTLYYEKNMGYREISVALGISMNTVGPKLSRAHSRLKKRMRWS